ncbi:MAG: hypothetical protein ACI4EX_14325 [Lachnospiraceae bacterium]
MDEKQIRKDRLRYTKNTVSSGLSYLAILLNVFYFVSIYKSDIGNYYYTWLIGASIIYNLLFMLIVFLCSEGVKNYHVGYSATLLFVGVMQFVRIFVIPQRAVNALVKIGETETPAMEHGQYMRVVVYLIISGALCIIAGIVGISKSHTLNSYLKELEAKEQK